MFIVHLQNIITGKLKSHVSDLPTEQMAKDEALRSQLAPEFYCIKKCTHYTTPHK